MKKNISVGSSLVLLIVWLLIFSTDNALAKKKIILSITGEEISNVVHQFNQSQPDYQIIIQNQKYRNWRYAINQFCFSQESTAKGSSGPIIDIAFIDNNWLAGMIQDHWLEDITGKTIKAENFVGGLAEAAMKDGKLYAIPFSNKGQVLFYRRDLHEKYGLDPPRTLKELERNARFLLEHERLEHGLTIHYSAIHLDILPFLWSNGGDILQNGKVVVNSPANIETLIYLQSLAREKVLPDPETFDALKGSYSNAKKMFIQGKSAYIITWNNRIADFENSALSEKVGILPIPTLKERQKSFSIIGSWYFAVNSFSAHKEGAVQFIKFFLEDKVQLDLALKSSSFIPAIRSVYSNSQLKVNNRYLSDIELALANMRHRLQHPQEPQISQIFENTIKEILIKGKPVKELLGIAQKRIKAICSGDTAN